MKIRLAYGQSGLVVELPDDRTTVVEPAWRDAAADPALLLRHALLNPVQGPPLRHLVEPGQSVAISVCDGTRAQPRPLMLAAVLEQLEGIITPDDIVVLVATGTHRGNTDDELAAMFGPDLLDRVRIVNHDGSDKSSLQWMGTLGAGVPVWLNRQWVGADVRVTTGFVEPHFFAGFSGGPKMVAPGLAGIDTVLTLHDARRIGHPMARWGITEGNPVHDDVRAIAAATGVSFAFDVVLNRDKEIVSAFAGELFAMHKAACAEAKALAMRAVPAPFDVVVTTNSGWPLDQNLYQAVKGMSAAAQVVRPGGMIVAAAECRDGFPDHGGYRDLLGSYADMAALLADVEGRDVTVPDQWQAQIQALVQARARVLVHSDYLSADDLAGAHLESSADVADSVGEALAAFGPDSRVCVLPEGPQTIPYLVAS
jgi:nickel-dependent lactate racemase